MLKASYPYYLANAPEAPNTSLEVTDKYTGEVATRVALADRGAIERAIDAADKAQKAMRKMPSYERKAVLDHCVKRFKERQEEFAQIIAHDCRCCRRVRRRFVLHNLQAAQSGALVTSAADEQPAIRRGRQ